jgi:glycine/D-amino acid oxidase-like deaminating enzyme
MVKLPENNTSFWQASAKALAFSEIKSSIETDVVIVGGGIAGLTCAYLLKQAGMRVVVLEKNTIGSGTTSKTTGKITSQHSLMYDELINKFNKNTAQIYADANQKALTEIIKLIKKEKIDCDLETDDNFVFTTEDKQLETFKKEFDAVKSLGLPASFQTTSDLPFKIKAAIKFSDQAKFNALKYVNALAKLVNNNDSHVFENSEATHYHNGRHVYVESNGFKVNAKYIIVATKVPAAPLVARWAYGFLEYPQTSYVVAGKYRGSLKGMYISPDNNHYSILPDSKNKLLLIGGEAHIPGLKNPNSRYEKLAEYASNHFGVSDFDYTWKGMDYIAYDNLPLIGKLYPKSENLYVVTGFKKWGLTTSMVAGIILRDLILGDSNPWAKAFDSIRIKPITSIPSKLF